MERTIEVVIVNIVVRVCIRFCIFSRFRYSLLPRGRPRSGVQQLEAIRPR